MSDTYYDDYSTYDVSTDLFNSEFDFKVSDEDQNIHRLRSSADKFSKVRDDIARNMGRPSDSTIVLKYLDDENDEVLVNSDAALKDAVDRCRLNNEPALRMKAYLPATAPDTKESPVVERKGTSGWVVGGGLVLLTTAAAAAAFVVLKNKK